MIAGRPRSPRRARDVTAREPWWPCPTAERALRDGARWSVGTWTQLRRRPSVYMTTHVELTADLAGPDEMRQEAVAPATITG